jgi:shikimate kinase
MGTGKSYWTKRLSKKLKIGGYDLDHLVESHEEKTIGEIFAEDGETYFRKTETKILHWFAEKKNFVLSTGGGTPCFSDNMDWMNKQGVTIWIDEPVEVLVQRLLPEKAHRPLIASLSDNELKRFLENKLAERRSFYNRAKGYLQGNEINEEGFIQILRIYA